MLFDIYYSGEVSPTRQREEVKANIQKLFNAGEQKMALLVSGEPCPVKLGVDKDTANKYKQAMLKAGAVAMLMPAGEEPTFSNNPFLRQPTEQAAKKVAVTEQHRGVEKTDVKATDSIPQPTISEVSVAAVGEGFLAEQVEFKERQFDFSDYSLAQTGSQIDPNTETETPAAPNTDHLSLQ